MIDIQISVLLQLFYSFFCSQAIFNGNGYDQANQAKLREEGVWCINSNVDAIRR